MSHIPAVTDDSLCACVTMLRFSHIKDESREWMTTITKWILFIVIAIVLLPNLFIWTPILFTLAVLIGIVILKLKFPMIKGAD